MTASSSFMELKISKPPSLHSPLSLVYIEDTLMAPWTDAASSFTNLIVDTTVNKPHLIVSSLKLFLFTCQLNGVTFSVMRYMLVSVSIESRTLMTPGCRRVRSFRAAFLARGSRDLFEDTSKVNMLHCELFS